MTNTIDPHIPGPSTGKRATPIWYRLLKTVCLCGAVFTVVLTTQMLAFPTYIHTARLAAIEGWADGSPDRLAELHAFNKCFEGQAITPRVLFTLDCASNAGGEKLRAIVELAENRASAATQWPLSLLLH